MMARPDSSERSPPPGGRFQFGMRGLMATVMLLCLPFAIWGGLLREGKQQGGPQRIVFVLLCVAAPIGVMLALSFAAAMLRFYRRLRPQRPADKDEADGFLSGR